MIKKRSAAIAATLATPLLVLPGVAQAHGDEAEARKGPTQGDEGYSLLSQPDVVSLLEDTARLGSERAAVAGSVGDRVDEYGRGTHQGDQSGIIVALAIPDLTELAQKDELISFNAPFVGVAKVAADGSYELSLSEEADLLESNSRLNLRLQYISDDATREGAYMTTLQRSEGDTSTVWEETRSRGEIEVVDVSEEKREAIQRAADLLPGEALDEGADLHGCSIDEIPDTIHQVPSTIGVAGTNTQFIFYDFAIDVGETSTQGSAWKLGVGDWFESSGGVEITHTSGTSTTWPSQNDYDMHSYRSPTDMRKFDIDCLRTIGGKDHQDRQEWAVVQVLPGGYTPATWPSTQIYEWCTPLSGTSITVTSGTATTWSDGLKSSWGGSPAELTFDMKTQAGYSVGTRVWFGPTNGAGYVCGNNGFPGASQRMIGDSWNRGCGVLYTC